MLAAAAYVAIWLSSFHHMAFVIPKALAMSPRIPILLILATAALTGCQQTQWVKPGATQADARQVRQTCQEYADRHGIFGTGVPAFLNEQAYVDRCVQSQGYAEVVVPGPAYR
jgi:hypothetical protein